ncbi:hypothetical protein THIOM_004224 [Candidatus Thiomargarita nelsonii]|uniref:Uncharacterized protein n=1 Tax=Candidatus Thiomargarita nelsonii TaxID=1003181 RepID=A0A176RWK2_9GAMM|nr:hypothetical protein THIOM_004224 [Candidatus Thiomargarita nelsonii]
MTNFYFIFYPFIQVPTMNYQLSAPKMKSFLDLPKQMTSLIKYCDFIPPLLT